MFYRKGKKVIKVEIEKYLTPLGLAICIMDEEKKFFFLELEFLLIILVIKM